MNSINDPSRHGEPNKLDEKDAVCAGCGNEFDEEIFSDANDDKFCGECMAEDLTIFSGGRSVWAYLGKRHFAEYMEEE